jgi:hypothetical protein
MFAWFGAGGIAIDLNGAHEWQLIEKTKSSTRRRTRIKVNPRAPVARLTAASILSCFTSRVSKK